jgi:hypothetical protein
MRHAVERPKSRNVQETISVSIPEEGMTLDEPESAVWAAASAAARDAITAACAVIEADAVVRAGDRVSLDRRRPLDVLTRFGWVRLTRWHVRDRQDNGYRHLLDEVIRLVPRQHASPWVIQQAAALAAQVTVRRAADFLAGYVETNVDHRTLHSLLRQPEIRDGAEAQRSPGLAQSNRFRQKSDR